MTAALPTNVPDSLRAGDTWGWTRTIADYPASVWTLKYRFKSAAGGFEVICTQSGDDHAANVLAATSAAVAAGSYSWVAWVEAGAEKRTVDSGNVVIHPDYRSGAASVALDDRSHARKMLAAIESWLETRNPAVAEYELAGRRMKYIPIGDLIAMRQRYQREIAAEEAATKLARGEGIGRKIQFRI